MDFSADLSFLYADFSVSVTHQPKGGGASTVGLGIFDRPGQLALGGDVLITDYALRYPVAAFPVVRREDTFVIAGVSYKVREAPQCTIDGLENTVPLAKVL